MKKFLLIAFVLEQGLSLQAQLKQIYKAPPSYIGGCRATANDYPYVTPFVSMDERFFVEFDDLEGDEKTYYYRIRRFDQDWRPTELVPQEYIEGYDSDMIQDQENSLAVLAGYTHYAFSIPNEQTRIKLSGNYLIEILDDDEEVVFNIPVVFYEKTVAVAVKAGLTDSPATLDTGHLVDFSLYPGGLQPLNPATDLTVKLFKNENLFQPRIFRAPTFYLGNELRYHEPDRATIPAGDEFLSFESRDLRGYNRGTDSTALGDYYEWYLPVYFPPRRYMLRHDIDGSFVFDAIGARDKSLETDYVRVHFRLARAALPANGKAYVVGRFNNWQTDERSLLRPVEGTDYAEAVIPLKQGYYDYYYVGRNADGSINWTAVTPSFSETENRYTVVVYYRPAGARYARAVGMGQAVSQARK